MSDERDSCQLLAELVGDYDGGQLSALLDTETRLQNTLSTASEKHAFAKQNRRELEPMKDGLKA